MYIKNVLLTRPQAQSKEITKNFSQPNINFIIEPLTTFYERENWLEEFNKLNVTNNDLILFTSNRAIKAFLNKVKLNHYRTCVISKNAAELLKQYDFKKIIIGDGDIYSLCEKVKLQKDFNRVIYLSAKNVSHDIEKLINLPIIRIIIYEMIAIKELSNDIKDKIKNGLIDYVTIFSLRNAKIFINLLEQSELTYVISKIKFIVISKKIADFLKKKRIKEVNIAKYKTLESVLKLLDDD